MVPIGSELLLDELKYHHISSYLNAFVEPVRTCLHVPTLEAEHAYLLERLPMIEQKRTFFYVLLTPSQRECIGAIEIRGQEHPGQLYCWMHPDFWGKNYFARALQCAAHLYFVMSGALYFTAHVDTDNMRSYYALKKCGFADYHITQGAYGRQYELILRNQSAGQSYLDCIRIKMNDEALLLSDSEFQS